MVALVDELEAAGLVARRPDPADRRARIVEPTPAGRRTLRAARADIRRAEDELLAALSPGERDSLRAQLRAVAAAAP
jgi:DNA-binding MarR family transcriptional regulator